MEPVDPGSEAGSEDRLARVAEGTTGDQPGTGRSLRRSSG